MWGYIAILLVSALISYALMPKSNQSTQPPAALEDFDAPVAQEGRPIPVVFGDVIVEGANVLWYGDLRVVAIKKKGGK